MKSENIIGSDRLLVGVAVAHKSLFVNQEDYIRLMAESSDALIRQLNATLVYIPNSFKAGPVDDSQTIHEIYQKISAKHRVRLIRGEYTAGEVKGVISRCDLFVSSKFHPLVASTSMAVPSVGLVGYHKYKFNGVIGGTMGQAEYLVNIDELDDYNSIRTLLELKVSCAWENRDSLRNKLSERANIARELALSNGCLAKKAVLHN